MPVGKILATNVTNVPAGGIAATDVQAAINELDTEKAGALTVEEIDGAPSVSPVTTLKVNNGTLTDSGGGIATLQIPIDIDGGSFADTFVNTADIDGGSF